MGKAAFVAAFFAASKLDHTDTRLWAAEHCQMLKNGKLETMPLEDLWALHETLIVILTSKIETQKRELDERIAERRNLETIGR